MDELIKLITCHITGKVFCFPVLASDNIVYEAGALIDIFEGDKISPYSGKEIDQKCIPVYPLRSLIDNIMKDNSEIIQQKGLERYSYKEGELESLYFISRGGISASLKGPNYSNALKYRHFVLSELDSWMIQNFLKKAPSNIIKHVIDNAVDLNAKINTFSFVHYVIKHSNPDIIVYLLSKGINLNTNYYNNDNILHQICYDKDGNDKLIKLILDRGGDLFHKNHLGNTALEYICKYCLYDTISYIINNIDTFSFLDDPQNYVGILKNYILDNEKMNYDQQSLLICIIDSKYNNKTGF